MFSLTLIIFVYGVCARVTAAAPWPVDDNERFTIVDDSQKRATQFHCASQDSNMVADGAILAPASPDSRDIDIHAFISTSCLAATAAFRMLSVAGHDAVDYATAPVPPSKRELDSPRSHWDPNADSTATFILRTRARVRGGRRMRTSESQLIGTRLYITFLI